MLLPKTTSWTKGFYFQDVDECCWEWSQPHHTNATSKNLQNAWIMFDHVKRVVGWTTMACHVYDPMFCKVSTIAVCDM